MATTLSWHIEKHKMDSLNGLQKHNQRTAKKHANQNIKTELSHLNFSDKNLDEKFGNLSYQKRIEKILEKNFTGTKKIRKDAVVDVEHTLQFGGDDFKNISQEKRNEMMQAATDFILDKFGHENVLDWNAHLDESNDHVHMDTVPLTADGRLSAKDLYARDTLKTVQQELLSYMQLRYPEMDFKRADEAERGFANGKSQADFEKLQKAKQELDNSREKLADFVEDYEEARDQVIENIATIAPDETLDPEEFEELKAENPDHGLTGTLAEHPLPFKSRGQSQLKALLPLDRLIDLFKNLKEGLKEFIQTNITKAQAEAHELKTEIEQLKSEKGQLSEMEQDNWNLANDQIDFVSDVFNIQIDDEARQDFLAGEIFTWEDPKVADVFKSMGQGVVKGNLYDFTQEAMHRASAEQLQRLNERQNHRRRGPRR